MSTIFLHVCRQDRRSRGERGGVHHPGHQRHQEGAGVPDQGQEEEDHDHGLPHHRRHHRHLHGRQVAGALLNITPHHHITCKHFNIKTSSISTT